MPDPSIVDPTDAIVRIDSSTICGTDLHILKGDVPETKPGTVLGHEAVGTVVEIGSAVTTIEPGDRALVFGADVAINNSHEDPIAKVMGLTDGLGTDVAIEAVGAPETFELCTELIRPGPTRPSSPL